MATMALRANPSAHRVESSPRTSHRAGSPRECRCCRAHSRNGVTSTRSRRPLASLPRATSKDEGSEDIASVAPGKRDKSPRKPTGEILAGLWRELKYVPLREDTIPEAVALMAALEASKKRPGPGEHWDDAEWRVQEDAANTVPEKIGAYWGAKWENLTGSEAVRDAAPLLSGAVNVAIAGVLLRLALPRVAALNAVGGFDELAAFFGLPPRAELSGYLDQLQGFPTLAVFAVYVGLFAAEKLTMTDEFLPIGFILPVVSPAVFGGVAGGTIVTSLASTLAASMNFWLGRTVLKEKALKLKWKDNPAIGESKWFKALSRRFDSEQFPESTWPMTEGFKSALLLRLCPILPIPLSGNWYVCGMTPLKFPEFFAAHFIGSSKTAFVDAYLGSLLLQAAFENDTVKEQAQSVLAFETVALVLISIGVTTYATDLFTQILEEEGIDASSLGLGDEDEDEDADESGTEERSRDKDENTASREKPPSIVAKAEASDFALDALEEEMMTGARRVTSESTLSESAPSRSPEEDAAAKWAAEAFVAPAVAEEPTKESWWRTNKGSAGEDEPTEEERALLSAMDAAAATALVNANEGRNARGDDDAER